MSHGDTHQRGVRCAAAVVLARAGSKGVPGKNTALVAGKPCVEWTLIAARESRSVGRVIVSTDCPAVARVGERYGADVIMRPAELATDEARVDDAARHAVVEAESRGVRLGGGESPIVLLYANVPVRPAGLIDECVRVLRESGAESVQSYSPVGKYHPWWTCVVEGDGRVRPFDGGTEDALFHGVYRRQSLPAAHVPDGGVMVVTRRALMLELGEPEGPHAFLGPQQRRRGVVSPEGSVVDIDGPADVLAADAALRTRGALKWERRAAGLVRRAG